MRTFPRLARSACHILLAVAASLALSGCLSVKSYVDPTLPTVSKADLPAVTSPEPVKILFEFRTKGSANATATSQLRPRIIAVAAESGLFANFSGDNEEQSSGVLKVVIDNIPLEDNAAAKGFGTGLTLGLAGSMVTDGYVCDMSYTDEDKRSETTVKHSLHTTIGNKSGPEGLAPMAMNDAVTVIMDQLVWNGLKQLSDKGAFE